MKKDEKNGGIFEMDKEKALKNQGSEFREDILWVGGRDGSGSGAVAPAAQTGAVASAGG